MGDILILSTQIQCLFHNIIVTFWKQKFVYTQYDCWRISTYRIWPKNFTTDCAWEAKEAHPSGTSGLAFSSWVRILFFLSVFWFDLSMDLNFCLCDIDFVYLFYYYLFCVFLLLIKAFFRGAYVIPFPSKNIVYLLMPRKDVIFYLNWEEILYYQSHRW